MNQNSTLLSEDRQLANRYALATVDMEEVIGYWIAMTRSAGYTMETTFSVKTCHELLSAAMVALLPSFQRQRLDRTCHSISIAGWWPSKAAAGNGTCWETPAKRAEGIFCSPQGAAHDARRCAAERNA